jgi:hypothetical protein
MLSKNLELSNRVFSPRVLILVRDPNEDPGSLKAICPLEPIPSICKSIPPKLIIFSSYQSQNFSISSTIPIGM